ncbi:MAG: MT-A70 family methyltransferase [Bacteroidota bacterium]
MKFDLIMICPPWKLYNRYRTRGPCLPDNLPPQLQRSINAFEFIRQALWNFTADRHTVVVWVPSKQAVDCRKYMARLGYTVGGTFTWLRPRWQRGSDKKTMEYLMVCHKGDVCQVSLHFLNMEIPNFPGTVKKRSAKPASVYEFLEKEFPLASKLQVYGWTKRPGWTVLHRNDEKIK